jgi:hypothetical protein
MVAKRRAKHKYAILKSFNIQLGEDKMTKSGVAPTLGFHGIDQSDQNIIRKFGFVWWISFTKREIYNKSSYTYAFATPTDELSHDFHLSREVLIVIPGPGAFIPRTLDFIDKILLDYQNRLDKLCVIIVSTDSDIKNKVWEIVKQDKSSRIIIPYTYLEIQKTYGGLGIDNFLIKRLKEYFYTRDLFENASPLKTDAYFFGRVEVIQSLCNKYRSGENACLFGLRRIGKTSTLYAVMRNMALRDEPAVYIDCSDPSLHRKRWYEVLYEIINKIIRYYELEQENHFHKMLEYDDKNASKCFDEDLSAVFNILGQKRILIILDEIEHISANVSASDHWSKENDFIYFWQSIRSIFQNKPLLFSFLISGVNPKPIEMPIVNGIDNPIYRFITPSYLPFFKVSEVKDMISSIGNYMGLFFEEELYTYLTDDFGGHPFLIRQACSTIHKTVSTHRPVRYSKFRYESERESLTKSIQDYVGLVVHVLREKYPDEYNMLEYLAQRDEKTFGELASLSNEFIEHLLGYGIIREDNGKYYFGIKAIENYVRERATVSKILNTKEEKWAEVSAQRNGLESNLRKLIKRTLKLRFGPIKSKEIFLGIIGSVDRKARFSNTSYDDLFESGIYFDELRKLIVKQWDEFGQVFNNDKEHFNSFMEYVNNHRVDAHANELDDETLGILLMSLEWLTRRVNEFLD